MSNIARSNANASGPRPTYVNSLNDKTMVKELPPPFGTMSTNPNNHKQISKLAIENKQYNIEQPMIKEQAKRAEAERAKEAEAERAKASTGGLLSMFFGPSAPAAAPAPTGAAAPVASNSAGSKFVSVGGRRSRKNKSKKSYKKSKKAKSNRK